MVSRTDYFLGLAEAAAARSSCPRAHVGAILTLDNSVVATGYNGAPRGMKHCDEVGCAIVHDGERERCIRTVHAEANALLQGLNRGSISGGVLYCTHAPCFECAKLIINARIQKVVYRNDYQDARAATVGRNEDLKIQMPLTALDFLGRVGIATLKA